MLGTSVKQLKSSDLVQYKTHVSIITVVLTSLLTCVTAATCYYVFYLLLPATTCYKFETTNEETSLGHGYHIPTYEMQAGRPWRQKGQEEEVRLQAPRHQVAGH